MPLDEWHARSFLIELKPRAEFASLFLDCPPSEAVNEENGELQIDASKRDLRDKAELLKVGERVLELRDTAHSENGAGLGTRFSARIADLCLHPNTICALTWADHRRLFMCKVHAEATVAPLVPKTFHRLEKDISSRVLLDEYVENSRTQPIHLYCAECHHLLLQSTSGQVQLRSIPEDDWLETSPSMEYFCRDSCGCSHTHGTHASDLITDNSELRWLPSSSRIIVANSFTLIACELFRPDSVKVDPSSRIIRCACCSAEVGILLKRKTNVFQIDHAVTNFQATNGEPYITVRFGCLERYFAWLLLSQCESQTSLKLVIRTYDKRPYLLIWLLESYVVLTSGDLRGNDLSSKNSDSEDDSIHSFPALKMLYKVFDGESAKSDPRANGEDASVGLVDVPLGCCTRLMQLLLTSSHALPPACRSVGQFYVGFLKLKDNLT